MLVTLFTDASFDHNGGHTGWGAWCKSNRASASAGGPIEEQCLSSNHAEMYALRYGLRLAARNGVLRPKDKILWRTDNAHAMNLINKRHNESRRRCADSIELAFIKELCVALDKWENTITSTHIKGHQAIYHPSQWVQNRCHKLALEAMRKSRDKYYRVKGTERATA